MALYKHQLVQENSSSLLSSLWRGSNQNTLVGCSPPHHRGTSTWICGHATSTGHLFRHTNAYSVPESSTMLTQKSLSSGEKLTCSHWPSSHALRHLLHCLLILFNCSSPHTLHHSTMCYHLNNLLQTLILFCCQSRMLFTFTSGFFCSFQDLNWTCSFPLSRSQIE